MKSDMENKDWLNDYKVLKQVNPATPFAVPDGYFDDLRGRITSLKKLDETGGRDKTGGFTIPEDYFDKLATDIASRILIEEAVNNRDTGFSVPEGYFDELTSNIQGRVSVAEALETEHNAFAVPEGYFDELAADIRSRIVVEEASNGNGTAFSVPDGYFDQLAGQINARVAIGQAAERGEEEFTVPHGYFEKLNQSILDKTVNAGPSRRRAVVRQLFASTAFKYATAACVALAIGGGIVLRELTDSPQNVHQNSFLHKELSAVPISEIKSYLQLNLDAGDTQQTISNDGNVVDDTDLRNALQNYADSVQ